MVWEVEMAKRIFSNPYLVSILVDNALDYLTIGRELEHLELIRLRGKLVNDVKESLRKIIMGRIDTEFDRFIVNLIYQKFK
jgi:hypothetical protein